MCRPTRFCTVRSRPLLTWSPWPPMAVGAWRACCLAACRTKSSAVPRSPFWWCGRATRNEGRKFRSAFSAPLSKPVLQRPLLHPNSLDIDEFAHAEFRQLTAESRALHAAEWKPGVGLHDLVDEHDA